MLGNEEKDQALRRNSVGQHKLRSALQGMNKKTGRKWPRRTAENQRHPSAGPGVSDGHHLNPIILGELKKRICWLELEGLEASIASGME